MSGFGEYHHLQVRELTPGMVVTILPALNMPFCVSIPVGQAECLGELVCAGCAKPLADQDINTALRHPLWPDKKGQTVFDRIHPGEAVCLVVSDQTRKTAADRILPVLLRGLQERGCRTADFFIIVACGIHRPPTVEEIQRILGVQMARLFENRIFSHDPDDAANLVSIGKTRRGHEVRLNRRAAEAQRLVLLGAATYHYHAGFGGGRKSLIPGLAARATIAYSHSLTLDPEQDRIHPGVEIGRLDDNPVAEEMLEGARLHPPDFIVNTVLTPDGKLAGVFAGELDLAHRAACRLVEKIDRVDIRKQADFVMADACGAGNWIQAHKALFNAARAVKDAGRIILIAPCPEGLGNERFRHWVTRPALAEIYRGLRQSPEVNGQTALSTRLRGARTILVTRLTARDAADLGLNTAPDLETAVRLTLDELARAGIKRPTYYLMPEAMATVPFWGALSVKCGSGRCCSCARPSIPLGTLSRSKGEGVDSAAGHGVTAAAT